MKKLLYLCTLIILFAACREDSDNIISTTPEIEPPKIVVNSSVLGTVVDFQGNPIDGATVDFRNLSTTTDENGVFSFKNVDLYQDGTYISVSKSGYFDGSRRFYAQLNKTSHIKIELIERQVIGNVSSTNGGEVSLNNASVLLPANGFVIDGTNTDYNGNVNVAMAWLNPTLQSTFDQMPGDLVGVNTSNDLMALESYGMIAVELLSDNGQLLNIKEGHEATITLDVPSSLEGSAPASIPLWFFDEENGLWIEEGEATLTNGEYVGNVSHFTFWNCDYPYDLITLSGAVTVDGMPINNLPIEVEILATGTTRTTFTNSSGEFTGLVPANEELKIRAYDFCEEVVWSQTIGPYAGDFTLNTQNVTLTSELLTISGTVTNCEDLPIESSYVIVDFEDGTSTTISTDANNEFNGAFQNCQVEATVFGVDATNFLVSSGVTAAFTGDTDLGELEACDELLEPRMILDYPGSKWNSLTENDIIAFTYELSIFDLGGGLEKYLYTFSILDWLTGEVINGTFLYRSDDPTATFNFPMESEGFTFGAMDGLALEITSGLDYIHFTGTAHSDDITITDSSLFDPNITEVVVDILIEL